MLKLFVENRKFFLPVMFFLLAFMVFQKNTFHTVEEGFFNSFQKDSESLVVGGIVANELQLEKYNWGLGRIENNGTFAHAFMHSYEIYSNPGDAAQAVYSPYTSQVGGQGYFYSAIQRIFSFESISKIQYFPSAMLAILVVAFFYLNRRIYGSRYALIFSASLALSPWVVAFARNLYWSPFLWLLPCFFATMAYVTKSNKVRYFSYLLIFLSFFAKALSGYEYITSITLLACSPFVLGPYFSGESKPMWRSATAVFSLCVLAFIAALLIHANIRGETISDGVTKIYHEDVKRRTYGDPSSFDPAYKDSLTVNPTSVVKNYIVSWSTPLITGVPGSAFKFLLVFVAFGLLVKKLIAHKTFSRDLILISYMFLIPLSWYVMARGHSHIHTHMNFVLWYLGLIPALIFVSLNSAVVFFKVVSKLNSAVVFFKVVSKYLKNLDVEKF